MNENGNFEFMINSWIQIKLLSTWEISISAVFLFPFFTPVLFLTYIQRKYNFKLFSPQTRVRNLKEALIHPWKIRGRPLLF